MSCVIYSQHNTISGTITDIKSNPIPGVKIINFTNQKISVADSYGKYSISSEQGDTIQFTSFGCDTLLIVIDLPQLKNNEQDIVLTCTVKEIQEVNIVRRRMEGFDVGFLPAIRGVQITTGTNAVIELAELNGSKSNSNPREIFAKIPGLNIWESDGSGIQIGIGGRGLSPDRAANFNTRQNGYDISADALGYPESYYTPPMEALKSIEIIRGSASLQFGTQFGGLLNFVIKEPVNGTPFEFTSRNTIGTYGYFGTFNRVTGTRNRFSYQVYHQYKRGNGYRENGEFDQHQAFAQIGYMLNENHKIRIEYTHMNYLAQQPGGLTDLQFKEDIRQSYRSRNWFNVNWNMLALHYDWEVSKKGHFNLRAFGMQSSRESVGFLEKITMEDTGGPRTLIAGDFKNAGVEARYLQKYDFFRNNKKNTLFRGAFLVGLRYYQGMSTSDQGNASNGIDPDFTFTSPENLENSSYSFPSQNAAAFLENILFLGDKWRLNVGMRYEYITSNSNGYYKQYNIHPVNLDTIAVYTRNTDRTVKRNLPLFGFGASRKTGKFASLYANWTQNYRAINFTDIRVTNPNFQVDSLMRDEYGFTSELGFRGLIKNYFIYDLAAYYLFYGDKIGLAPKSGTIYKERTNIGDAQNYGVEFYAEIDLIKAFKDSSKMALSYFANLAYTNANYIRSKETSYIGKKVEYVSSIIAKSGIKFKTANLSIQVMGSYNSEQFTDATNSIEPSGDAVIGLIPSYLIFDFSARYTFNKYFSIEGGVNNFTNQKYFTRRATSYPGPGIIPSDGINVYSTLQFKFSAK